MFTSAVAKGRGVAVSEVIHGFGEGRMMTATNARAAGMVDRIATLPQVLSGAGIVSTNPRLAAKVAELQRLARGPSQSSFTLARHKFHIELERKPLALLAA